MPVFEYEAMDAQGNAVTDTIESESSEQAISAIREQGLFPTRVTQKKVVRKVVAGGRRGGKKKAFVIGGVSSKQLNTFTRQLSTLTDAGIPVVQSLDILQRQMKPCALKNVLGDVADEVEGGMSLSEGMAKHPKAFDTLYTNMVKAGETGGMLDIVLNRLADFREKAARLKRKVIGALVYPVFVILAAGGILTFLVYKVIPKFIAMFEDLDVELPAPTRLLLAITNFATTYWYVVLLAPVALIVSYKLIRFTRTGRNVFDWMKFKIPLFGKILNKSAVSRFARTFGTLMGSGVPILEALNISRDTAGNALLSSAIQNVHDSVREGDPIAGPLGESRICEDMVVNMIDVGEETGNLDSMLLKIADNYDDEVDTAVEGLTSLMEPIMVITLGGIVGFIVISLFMPLIKLMSSL
ncbi:MAG: type II secretion system F family protein [Planctomycetes bacterium]|nr:type II secretion system F family protein [Planctomycetota bacterium]